jgi:hypothetical protein
MVTAVIGSRQGIFRFFSKDRSFEQSSDCEDNRSRPQRGGEKIVTPVPSRKGQFPISKNNFFPVRFCLVFPGFRSENHPRNRVEIHVSASKNSFSRWLSVDQRLNGPVSALSFAPIAMQPIDSPGRFPLLFSINTLAGDETNSQPLYLSPSRVPRQGR